MRSKGDGTGLVTPKDNGLALKIVAIKVGKAELETTDHGSMEHC